MDPGDYHRDRLENVHDWVDIYVHVHIYLGDSYLEISVEPDGQNDDNDLFVVNDTHQHPVVEVSYHVDASQVFLDDKGRTRVTDGDYVHGTSVHHGPSAVDVHNQYSLDCHHFVLHVLHSAPHRPEIGQDLIDGDHQENVDDDYDAHDIVQGVCGYLVVVGELVVSLGLEVANIFSFQRQHQLLGLAVYPAKDKKNQPKKIITELKKEKGL